MHVAVSIVGFRNASDVVRCVAALECSTHKEWEVIICENGGPEAYAELVAAIPQFLTGGQEVRAVLASHNLGFAGGVNVCMAETSGSDAWWVLNPDTLPEPDAMARLIAKLADGTCDAVGCVLYLTSGVIQSYGGRWQGWVARPVSIGNGNAIETPFKTADVQRAQNYLNGASMLISRRFLTTVGPMREDYFLYCEEVEWCLRGAARGMRLGIAADARVLHFQGTTTGAGGDASSRSRLSVYLGERNKLLITRDCFPGRLAVATLAALLLHLWRFGRRGAWAQVGYGLAGLWAGLRGERGMPAWAEGAANRVTTKGFE